MSLIRSSCCRSNWIKFFRKRYQSRRARALRRRKERRVVGEAVVEANRREDHVVTHNEKDQAEDRHQQPVDRSAKVPRAAGTAHALRALEKAKRGDVGAADRALQQWPAGIAHRTR